MGSRSITIPISASGFNVAVAWLEGYKNRLEKNTEEIVKIMLQDGEMYAINFLGHIDTGETLNSIMAYRNGNEGMIVAHGNAIWIEFGTGVAYNSSLHPKAAELHMKPHGTYGKGYGANPNGWYYKDDNGDWHHTKGIPQNRFLYTTAQTLRKEYKRIAQEVFG